MSPATAAAPGPLLSWSQREGSLRRLRLSRPKANVVDAAMTAALDRAFAEAGEDSKLRGILLDAEGPHFSFGASVEEHLPATVAQMLRGLHGLVLRMLACPVPLLVAIRGQCLGGGLEVASAGSVLFASPEARLGQPEIQLGVFAPAASCLLPERMGRRAEDLLLSGRPVDGREAHRLGLVDALADDPEAAALSWFDQHLAPRSASSLRFALRAARTGLEERVRGRIAAVEKLYLDGLMSTRDAVEGLTAFIEKRPARWEDR